MDYYFILFLCYDIDILFYKNIMIIIPLWCEFSLIITKIDLKVYH